MTLNSIEELDEAMRHKLEHHFDEEDEEDTENCEDCFMWLPQCKCKEREMMSKTYNFNFNGVDVTVYHHPEYFHSSDHVEWRSVPCSITETGYYSMWLPVNSTADDVKNLILETVGDKPVTVYVPPLEQQDLFN